MYYQFIEDQLSPYQEEFLTESFNVGELKSKFSNILQWVEAGEEIIISFGKTGKKIAVLVPYDKYLSNAPRPLGLLKGKARCTIKDGFDIERQYDLGLREIRS